MVHYSCNQTVVVVVSANGHPPGGRVVAVPAREIPVAAECDVLVCGGGVAGLSAAVAAARAGARTVLAERAGFLGGTATGALMALIVIPFEQLSGFPRELFGRLADRNGAGTGQVVPWDPEEYKLVALEMAQEAGVDVLLYSVVSEPITDGRVVRGAILENKSGRQAILSRVTIDATADADVAARAGAAFQRGRESDGAMRPATVMGRFANVDLLRLARWVADHPGDFAADPNRRVLDLESGLVRIDGFYSVVEEAKQRGLLPADTPVNYLRFSGLVRPPVMAEHADLICNSTRVYGVDGTRAADLTRGEIEGRRQLHGLVGACRQLLPGFENSFLVSTSSYLGVRETRRIVGRHTLTYDEMANRHTFPDSIAVMSSVDYGTAEVHGPEAGHEGSREDRWARDLVLELTQLEFPAAALVPRDLDGLLVAGRCASVTHDVDKFTRNMGPAALMGQAAGTLAATLTQGNGSFDDLPIAEAQDRLRAAGVPVHLPDVAAPAR